MIDVVLNMPLKLVKTKSISRVNMFYVNIKFYDQLDECLIHCNDMK